MSRYRPPKHIRETIGKGRVTSNEKKRLIIESTPDHLLVDTKAERPRENWFVTAQLTHRTKYGWHYQKRMMNRAKDQHPSGCHVETPTTPTESRHEGTQFPELPRRDLPTVPPRAKFGTPEYSRPKRIVYR